MLLLVVKTPTGHTYVLRRLIDRIFGVVGFVSIAY
jgi:hypothetical protein